VVLTNLKHRLIQRVWSLPIRGNGFFALKLAKVLFPQIRDDIRVSTLDGFDIIVHGKADAIIEQSVYYTGTYEKGTIHLMKQLLKEGDVFIDAGANIGLMSMVAATCVGQGGSVHAFEPFPLIYDRMLHNIHLNQFTNIKTYQMALAAAAGEAYLYPDHSHNPGASSLIDRSHGTTPIAIRTGTLDTYFSGAEKIALIKIDVEGYEGEVLKGATRLLSMPEAPALIVECSSDRENYHYSSSGLFEYIKGINHYRVFKLKRGKGHIAALVEVKTPADLPVHDNLYCFLPHHFHLVS
jgi:FkbM family methyltransferase